MPANIGEMFYTGATPWHGLGVHLAQPANLDEALKVGGLNWRVEEVDLVTADDPPSPVPRRKALVRSDRPPGDERRVLGVTYRGFTPIQNQDAGFLFDAIFGNGQRVYHTGGYLGKGEKIWLLAKINHTLTIAGDDIVQPFALMANSHDGSMAFNIRLTTIRVVCQNTLTMAMHQNLGSVFRRDHQGPFVKHAAEAQNFFAATMTEVKSIAASFTVLSERRCADARFNEIVLALVPDPKKPRLDGNPGLKRAWENKVAAAEAARKKIAELRLSGKGQSLRGAKGTFWGALNAVLEYVDHYQQTKQSRLAYALFGDGMALKTKAFQAMQEEARKAA